MRVVFMGSGPFAVPTLEALHARPHDHELVAVISRPDRPGRRGRKLEPTPLAARAAELGIDCSKPESINSAEFVAWLEELTPDLTIVADYGQILRRPVMAAPRIGTYNLHGSILPDYRGAAPVACAIRDGRTETGVTLFRIERGLDSGPIVAVRRTEILPDETAAELEERLARIAAELLSDTLPSFADGSFVETPQDADAATLAPKLSKDDGEIDWRLDAVAVKDHVRAMNPWPMAWSHLERGGHPPERTTFQRVAVHSATEPLGEPGQIVEVDKRSFSVACGRGAVRVVEIQKPGKPAMAAAAYLNGNRLEPGDRFVRRTEEGKA